MSVCSEHRISRTMYPMKRVYIETTIPSYLAAMPSGDLLQAAHQQVTHRWWSEERHKYELLTSQLVVSEAARGHPDPAGRRLALLQGIELLDLSMEVEGLAAAILESRLVPAQVENDAFHIAFAAVHDADILLTWNCRHIANPVIMAPLAELLRNNDYDPPLLCTPEYLLEEEL
jgi:hypothetical protein